MRRLRQRLGAILRTTTFHLTLSYIALFGISVSLLTLFFYWSTIGLIVRETDATLKSEITGLAEQYLEHGLDRLVQVIAHRIRNDPSGDMLYLFTTRDNQPLAGNLAAYPSATPDEEGWIEFVHRRADGREVLLNIAICHPWEWPRGVRDHCNFSSARTNAKCLCTL